tara:strand:+ start:231401 stop:232795 length:1395 start_codon:yes stop_codon:yes gene_type:complete
MKRSIVLMTFLLILSSCSSLSKKGVTAGQPAGEIPVKKFVLDNGLTLLVSENDQLPIFSYYTFYNVGGRHESEGTTGATHFLEHMMFKGAKKYGPKQFDTTIEANGGSTNAYTNFDSTVYYQSMPSHMIEKIIDMEADRMENLLLEEESFEAERKVIFEERKMRYENSPRGQLYLTLMKEVFKGTPYGGSVIGSEQDLANLSRTQVREFFKNFYRPDNATIVIVGNVDADEVHSMVKEKFAHMEQTSSEITNYKKSKDNKDLYEFKNNNFKKHTKLYGQSPTPLFMMGYRGLPLGEREAFVMDILATVLGQSASSYLIDKLVASKNPMFSSLSTSNYNLKYNGVFFVSGQLLEKKSFNRAKNKLLKTLKRSCREAINARSVQKTKNQYLVDFYHGVKTNKGVAQYLGQMETLYGDFNFYKKELEIYNSITEDELRNTCHELFNDNKYFMVSVWDKYKKPAKGRR